MPLLPFRSSALPLLALLSSVGAAQVPVKVDLNPTTVALGSNPRGFTAGNHTGFRAQSVSVGGKQVFAARTGDLGEELWSTDGTTAGTQLIIDLDPGPGSGVFGFGGVSMGGRLYFVGSDSVNKVEVWSTDGTADGTTLLKGPAPWNGWQFPQDLVASGGRVYFLDGAHPSSDLWTTDGTTAGTYEILPDGTGGVYWSFVNPLPDPTGSGLYFGVLAPVFGYSIWYTDGTQAGTFMLADLDPGTGSTQFNLPVALGNKVLFTSYTSVGSELYITDGTSAGTQLVIDLEPGPAPSFPFLSSTGVLGGLLYYSATTSATGRELFQTDGTAAGTILVTDAVPGPAGSDPTPLGVAGGKLIVSADLGIIGPAIYALNQGILQLLIDTSPNSTSPEAVSGHVIGNRLMFTSSGAPGFFVTDGSPAGTVAIPESVVGESSAIIGEVQPGVAILAGDNGVVGIELMQSDGTIAGTGLLEDIELAAAQFGSSFSRLGCGDGDNLFALLLHSSGPGLVGVAPGQQPEDLFGSGSPIWPSDTPEQVWLGDHGELVIPASDSSSVPLTTLLVGTDGTQGGTTTLATVPDAQGNLTLLGSDGQHMLLFGTHKTYGPELWSSDGTTAGTQVLGDLLPPGPLSSLVSSAVRFEGSYYFSLPDAGSTMGLWRSDGTLAGTSLLIGGLIGEKSSGLQPAVAADQVFFVASDGITGMELWVTDGTSPGTHLVKDISPGKPGSRPVGLREFQGRLVFFAKTATSGPKTLWESDGTAAGTNMLSSAQLPKQGEVVVAGDYLYFEGKDANGKELWAYDGQTASSLGDLTPGAEGSEIADLTACGDQVYFTATSPGVGREIHLGDAATSSIALAFDLNPGPGGSSPGLLTLCGGSLFFEGTGADGDHELYVFDTQEAHILPLGLGWAEAHLSASTPALGSTVTMTVKDAPTGSLGVLVVSTPIEPLGIFVAPGNTLWVDPTSFSVLGFGSTSSWTATQPIPNQPGLVGLQVNVQAWFLPPSLLPAETSNGLRLVLGI